MLVTTTATAVIVRMPTMITIFMFTHPVVEVKQQFLRSSALLIGVRACLAEKSNTKTFCKAELRTDAFRSEDRRHSWILAVNLMKERVSV